VCHSFGEYEVLCDGVGGEAVQPEKGDRARDKETGLFKGEALGGLVERFDDYHTSSTHWQGTIMY